MVRFGPVERSPVADKDLFRREEVQDKLLVVDDAESIDIKTRKQVERPSSLFATDTVDLIELPMSKVALFGQPTLG